MGGSPLDYLFRLEQFGIKFGLENISALVADLGHPERRFAVVHVAGTNGKGSVTALVDAALRAAGYRAARYTSPHLVDLTERFVIGGRPVGHEEMAAALGSVQEAADRLTASGAIDTQPTFFEATTAAAFELFRRRGVEVAVCEVGLGGRLDATNVVAPVVTAITSIALDHQQYLGDDIGAIAREKAGIIKPGVPVVVGAVEPTAGAIIAGIAEDRGSPMVRAFEGTTARPVGSSPDGSQIVRLVTAQRDYRDVRLALAGQHQIGNAVVAVRVLEELSARGFPLDPAAIVEGLASVRWPGRLERIAVQSNREMLLDAAHNPSGASALAAHLREHGIVRPLVFAAMRDKDVGGMLRALLPAVSALIVTRASNVRSADPLELQGLATAMAPRLTIRATNSVADALSCAWALDASIVVAGSIFLLGDVMQELSR